MDPRRTAAAATIGITGLGLLGVAVRSLGRGVQGIAGWVLVGAVLVLGVSFSIAGPVLYRSSVDSEHLLRVAGWNALGVIVTMAVLALVAAFQVATGGRVTAPLLSGTVILGVSAFAHVLIGVNDVRRIRARTVADQRQKAAVVNRFVRHDLRHAAQLLIGYSDEIRSYGSDSVDEDDSDGGHEDLADRVASIGRDLSETQSRVKIIDELLDGEGVDDRTPVVVSTALDRRHDELTDGHPNGTVRIDSEGEPAVLGGDHVVTAVSELVENALQHGGDPADVRVRETRAGREVEITVLDDGDGFPENERALINDDEVETQLRHSSGMGLWLAKWVIEFYGGTLSVGTSPDGGGEATVRLPAADAT
ncbi:sensor histidine kinase [Halobaculum magnesiiphilum]|uniref:histidine kinase n=1 Tax=Halobaculum magnesiiphilum TaxID=1017351 RepID=A0A8T8WII1_9EURY|nr:HAMP domain-containing sensor histidine kinase [Halobaculum magnesiiphilum]QZP39669.1 HAMP domain-containing histidine kinase [Halobaculum magnesiiphilum]